MKNHTLQLSVVLLSVLMSITLVPSVSAETTTLEIAGNGAESANAVSTAQENTTNVQSNNQATVTTTINTNADTGNNSVDNNTGDEANITTGDIKTSTNATTETNVTSVTTGCCENTSSTTTVSNNGAGSTNEVNNNHSTSTNVSVNNNASIENNIYTKANTGRNSADNNTGSKVTIKTGDIKVTNKINNGKVNEAHVKALTGEDISVASLLKIAGNGAYSDNIINYDVNNETNIEVNNITSLLNNVEALLNTGENHADDNTGGKVNILTGDIDIETIIDNLVNISIVEVVCGCDKETPEKPETPNEVPNQPEVPTTTTSVGGPGGPSTSSNGDSNGSSSGPILPATGNNLLFFLLLANIMMFFLGTYLRLRSGRSPGYAFAL